MPRVRTFLLTLAVVLSGLALAPTADAAALTTEAEKLPKGLVGASAVYVDGKTYVLGGRTQDGTYSSDVYAFDHTTRTISDVGDLPASDVPSTEGGPGRYSATAVAIGKTIYLFGGATLIEQDINGDGTKEKIPRASKDVIVFDTTTRSSRLLADELPLGAWGMASITTDQRNIYLFGGFTFDVTDLQSTGRHDRILKFDTGADEPFTRGSSARFETLASELPYTVQDAAVALIGPRRVYIMGGLSDHDNNTNPCPTYSFDGETRQTTVCQTKRIVTFDPESDLAIGVSGELPYRAQFISAATVAQKAYVSGALLPDQTASASVVEVSLDRNGSPTTRVLVPSLPRGAFGQAVATDGQTILILGGRFGGERDLSSDIIRLDPRPTPPWPPRAATSVEIQGGVRLSWEPPSYTGDSPITGYRVYRAQGSGEEVRIADTTTLTYDDLTIRPGTEYTWRVSAVNAAGEGALGSRITRSSGIATPGPVASFEAYAGNGQVLLRWIAPNETGGSNLTGYRIVRNDQLIASPPPDATEYIDRSVTNGETYLYQVRAYNAKGDGTLSAAIRATPALVPAPPTNLVTEIVPTSTGTSTVRVSWVASDSAAAYSVYRSTRAGILGSLIENVSTTSTVDDSVEKGQTYYYTVVGRNEQGASPPSESSVVSLVRKPGAPTQIVALGQDGEIRIAWQPPEDTGDAPVGLLRYYVSRSAGGQSSIVKTDLETTLYVDRFVTPGLTYTYTVTTLNPLPSDPSPPATAAAKAIQNKAPFTVLAAIPPLANAGDPIELDASSSVDIDGTIRSYLFDFGDGTDPVTTEQPSVSHQYAVNGTYNATVIAKDDRGLTALAYAQIIIGEVITDEQPETGMSGVAGPGGARTNRTVTSENPGSQTPALPGPSPALILVALVAIALALRRRR